MNRSGGELVLHSEYMVQLCENGMIGFVLLMLFYVLLFVALRKNGKRIASGKRENKKQVASGRKGKKNVSKRNGKQVAMESDGKQIVLGSGVETIALGKNRKQIVLRKIGIHDNERSKGMVLFGLIAILFLNLTGWSYNQKYAMVFYAIFFATAYADRITNRIKVKIKVKADENSDTPPRGQFQRPLDSLHGATPDNL